MVVKICTNCLQELDESRFHRRKLRSGNYSLREHCKDCRKAISLEAYKKKDKQQHCLDSLRYRASRQGVPFDLGYDDITPPDTCPVLGVKMERYTGGSRPNSPSVDRIIPALGYVKGNIQVISLRANMMKSDASPEELKRFAKWVLQQEY